MADEQTSEEAPVVETKADVVTDPVVKTVQEVATDPVAAKTAPVEVPGEVENSTVETISTVAETVDEPIVSAAVVQPTPAEIAFTERAKLMLEELVRAMRHEDTALTDEAPDDLKAFVALVRGNV